MQFLFDDHVLDVERRELRRAGERIAMEPQVFDLLVHLVRNRDRVLSKDDLIEAIWDGRVVSESTLTSRINAVRKAVGDSGKAQRLIRTVQRKGIRFIGEVSEAFAPREVAVAAKAEPQAPALRHEIQFCTASDGVRIAYAEVGTGPPLLKAANWLNHLEHDWESPIWSHLLRELAAEHRLIRYDARGNGLSDWEVDDISFEAFARDLESVVEATGIDRFALLGISQGCAVSIAYAVRHPQRVSHLVLYGGFARGRRKRGSPRLRLPLTFSKRRRKSPPSTSRRNSAPKQLSNRWRKPVARSATPTRHCSSRQWTITRPQRNASRMLWTATRLPILMAMTTATNRTPTPFLWFLAAMRASASDWSPQRWK